jgi:hypothetical protein
MLQPISLIDIKPRFLCQSYSGIKVCSTLKFFPKTSILLELAEQGCELFFRPGFEC